MNLFELFVKLSCNSSELERGLDQAQGKASGFMSGLGKIGKLGAAAFGATATAVGIFAKKSVDAGMAFDSSMSQVAATMGNVDKSIGSDTAKMELLRQKATELGVAFDGTTTATELSNAVLRKFAQEEGRTTAFSATQAADALNYMALAGYDAVTSVNMLPNVLNLAAAGNMDLARASDMVTDTQTAFGITLERTSQMVDEMAKAASTGNTSVEQLGDAFLTVGGLAKELNGGMLVLSDGTMTTYDNVTELEIALTAMANAGIKGSEAGTHLRNMLMKLSAPTDDGAKALEELGVQVFNSEGKMESLAQIMEDLSVSMGDLTQSEKLEAISKIFNARDTAAAEALMSAIDQDWAHIAESILDAEGAAEQMAATQLDNLAGDVTLFKSALEGAQIALSDQLTPALRTFVQFGTQSISDLSAAFTQGGIEGLSTKLTEILGQATQTLINGIPTFTATIFTIMGSIGEAIMANAPVLLTSITTVMGQLLTGLMAQMPAMTEAGVSLLQSLGEGVSNGIPALLNQALPMILKFTETLRKNFGKIVDAGIKLLLKFVDGIVKAMPALISYVPQIITNIAGLINDNLPKIILAGAQIIIKLVKGLWDNRGVILQNMGNILLAVVNVITAINWISLGQHIINFITNGVRALFNNLPNLLHSIGEKAVGLVKGINWGNLGSSIITMISNGIRGLLTAIPNLLKKIALDGVQFVKGIDWLSLGGNIISGIVSGISSAGGKIGETLMGFAESAWKKVKSFFGINSPSRLMRDTIGKFIPLGMAEGIEEESDSVTKAMDELGKMTQDAANMSIGGIELPTLKGIENTDDTMTANSGIESLLKQIFDRLDGMQIVLDTGAIAGAVTGRIDTRLGSMAYAKGIGV